MIVGIGIDCEEIERWIGLSAAAVSDPRHSLFSESEHIYCSSNVRPEQHYAGRWCLKEAAVKALAGRISITPRDVEVRHVPNASPEILIRALSCLPERVALMTSVTHSEKMAAAVVIAEIREG